MNPETWLRYFAERTTEFALMFLDPEGRILWWSPGAEYIFGHAPEDIVGRPLAELFVEVDRERGIPNYELESARSGLSAHDDRWMLRKDGSRFWASGTVIGLHNEANEFVGHCKILRDRTDWKTQIRTLKTALEQYRDFHATLSHELRNALMPLLNTVELLRLKSGEQVPARHLDLMTRQLQSIHRLVEDITDVARMQTGKMNLQRETFDLRRVTDNAVDALRAEFESRRQQLKVVMLPVPIEIVGDADRVHQALLNLLRNAHKYTPDDGQIGVQIMTEGKEAVIRIDDTGCGIAPELLPKIFELFTQASPQHEHEGLGIGLSLVHEIANLHGGSVQARSEGVGKGSQFTMRLPLAPRMESGG